MKGKLHKSMNYGWMIQDKVNSFYPLYPYDLFTNSIERVEGKEVDFTLVYSWNEQEEKLIEVAIISANITDVPQPKKDEITCGDLRDVDVDSYMKGYNRAVKGQELQHKQPKKD